MEQFDEIGLACANQHVQIISLPHVCEVHREIAYLK